MFETRTSCLAKMGILMFFTFIFFACPCYAENNAGEEIDLYHALYATNLITCQTDSLNSIKAILGDVGVPCSLNSVSENENELQLGSGLSLVRRESSADSSDCWYLRFSCTICNSAILEMRIDPLYTMMSLKNGDISFDSFYMKDDISILPPSQHFGLSTFPHHQCQYQGTLSSTYQALILLSEITLGESYDSVIEHVYGMQNIKKSVQPNGSVLSFTVFDESGCCLRVQMKFNCNQELYAILLQMSPPADAENTLSEPFGIDASMNVDIEVGIVVATFVQ